MYCALYNCAALACPNGVTYLVASRGGRSAPDEGMGMPFLPLRQLDSAGRGAYDRWIGAVGEQLADDATDRNALCRRILTELFYPQYADADVEDLPEVTRLALLQLDPRYITLEPEYYSDIDPERYAPVKPLI